MEYFSHFRTVSSPPRPPFSSPQERQGRPTRPDYLQTWLKPQPTFYHNYISWDLFTFQDCFPSPPSLDEAREGLEGQRPDQLRIWPKPWPGFHHDFIFCSMFRIFASFSDVRGKFQKSTVSYETRLRAQPRMKLQRPSQGPKCKITSSMAKSIQYTQKCQEH